MWPFRKIKRLQFYHSEDVPTDSRDLARTMELAGFFMSHAIWCVSAGESLVPLIGFEDRKGWHLLRMMDKRLEDGVERGDRWVESNPEGSARAVLIYDGYYSNAARRTDALFAKVIQYDQERWHMDLILPYRHATSSAGFAVHRPKLRDDGENDRKDWLMDAFFHGGDLHERGAEVWDAHLDESF